MTEPPGVPDQPAELADDEAAKMTFDPDGIECIQCGGFNHRTTGKRRPRGIIGAHGVPVKRDGRSAAPNPIRQRRLVLASPGLGVLAVQVRGAGIERLLLGSGYLPAAVGLQGKRHAQKDLTRKAFGVSM